MNICDINFLYSCFVKKFFNFLNTSKKIQNNIQKIKLDVGEAIFWKDSEILHGRNGFAPKKDSDRFLWKAAINIGR